MCIIPGEGEIHGPTRSVNQVEPNEQVPSQPPLKLVKLWQRLMNGQWVIGAVVQNQSSE